MLTALITKPSRLIYISSELHKNGDASLKDLNWNERAWRGTPAYSDSKLHNVLLAFAVARHWPDVLSNAIEPGWVATKMGGPRATGNLDEGHRTQAWLAVSDDPAAKVTGEYFFHKARRKPLAATRDVAVQGRFWQPVRRCRGLSCRGEGGLAGRQGALMVGSSRFPAETTAKAGTKRRFPAGMTTKGG